MNWTSIRISSDFNNRVEKLMSKIELSGPRVTKTSLLEEGIKLLELKYEKK